MKISECCGAEMNGHDIDYEMCPDCHEHCEAIDQDYFCCDCGEVKEQKVNEDGFCGECSNKHTYPEMRSKEDIFETLSSILNPNNRRV